MPDSKRFDFSKAKLQAIKPPAKGRISVRDARHPALECRITSTGHRAYYWYRKIQGKPVRVKIADMNQMTATRARQIATQHDAQAVEGHNPMDDRRAAREAMTLDSVRLHYIESKILKPSTQRSEDNLYEKVLKKYHNTRLDQLADADVLKLHKAVTKARGERTANRAVTYINRLYKHAQRFLEYRGPVPTQHVKLHSEQQRDRFLEADELPRFLKSLDLELDPFPDFFRLLLFTGQRSGNVRAMRWDQLDLKRGTWTIEATQAKNATSQTFQLLPEALEILQRRREAVEGDWVFPAVRLISSPHISQPTHQMARICKRAKIKGLTIHDLRRSLGSWMAMTGASLPMIGAVLGHKDPRSTAIYARLAQGAASEAQSKGVQKMLSHGKKDEKKSKKN